MSLNPVPSGGFTAGDLRSRVNALVEAAVGDLVTQAELDAALEAQSGTSVTDNGNGTSTIEGL